jgi:peroxiredoxin
MAAALVFVAALCVINLLLTLLVARRLGARSPERPARRGPQWLATGTQIPPFEAAAVTGERVSLDTLRGRWSMVGFFAVGCEPCREQLPMFAEHAAEERASRTALAVIMGAGKDADDYVAQLQGQALVVREYRDSVIADAFAVLALPSVYLLDAQGRVVLGGPSVAAVRARRRQLTADR